MWLLLKLAVSLLLTPNTHHEMSSREYWIRRGYREKGWVD